MFVSWIKKKFSRGGTRWVLKPVPLMPAVYTIGVVEKACAILEIDVDLVISGDIELAEIELPPLAKGVAFLQLVVENGDKYDVREWTPGQYEGVMQAILANFFEIGLELTRANLIRAALDDRAGNLSTIQAGRKARGFTESLGSLAPADFDMAFNRWPLHTFLVWVKLRNLHIQDDHVHTQVAQAAARTTPHI